MNTADRWWPSTRHWLARLSQAKSTIAHDSPMTPTRLLDAARSMQQKKIILSALALLLALLCVLNKFRLLLLRCHTKSSQFCKSSTSLGNLDSIGSENFLSHLLASLESHMLGTSWIKVCLIPLDSEERLCER